MVNYGADMRHLFILLPHHRTPPLLFLPALPCNDPPFQCVSYYESCCGGAAIDPTGDTRQAPRPISPLAETVRIHRCRIRFSGRCKKGCSGKELSMSPGIRKKTVPSMEMDLKPFMNLMVVLIPMLLPGHVQ
jgi:hypothetical protein